MVMMVSAELGSFEDGSHEISKFGMFCVHYIRVAEHNLNTHGGV